MMSEQWPLKPLGEICDILDRLRKPITKRNRVSGEYPYYGATGIVDYVDDYIFDEKLILIGEDGAKWESGENTAFSVEGKCWVNNHAHVIRPNRNIVLDNWLIYFLNMSDLTEHITGLTVPKLNQGKLRAIQIPIPPLEEQQRIVSILDEACKNISNSENRTMTNIMNIHSFFEILCDKELSGDGADWPLKELDEICSRFEYGSSAKSHVEGEVPVLRMGNMQNREIDWSNLKYSSDNNEIEKYLLRKNDVLFNRTNSSAHVGKAAIYRGEREALFAGYLIRIHYEPKLLDPEYLNYFLNGKSARDHGKSVMSESINQANINATKLKQYSLYLPPIEIQHSIVNRLNNVVDETLAAASMLQDKLSNLTELRLSILQEAFNGNLTKEITA